MWASGRTESKEPEPNCSSSITTSYNTRLFRIGNEIYFSDDITYQTMHELVKILKETENDLQKNVDTSKSKMELNPNLDITIASKPIMLYITTHGGSVYAVLRVIDIIEKLKIPVHTVVSGYVASAGTLLSMIGKKRYITKHSFMLIHELRSTFWGKYSDAREHIDNLEKLMSTIVNIIKDKSKLTEEELKEILKRDCNWDANECLEKGLVDEIL